MMIKKRNKKLDDLRWDNNMKIAIDGLKKEVQEINAQMSKLVFLKEKLSTLKKEFFIYFSILFS